MRQIECKLYYVQELNAEKLFEFNKVPGSENPAGVGTKYMPGDAVLKHDAFAGGVFAAGRPSVCPKVHERLDVQHIPAEGGCETLHPRRSGACCDGERRTGACRIRDCVGSNDTTPIASTTLQHATAFVHIVCTQRLPCVCVCVSLFRS